MYCERLTVKKLKEYLKAYNVPDDALITCQSDVEGNSESVCMEVFIDRVGREEEVPYGDGNSYHYVAGKEVLGIDEKDKGRIFVTFRPMY